MVVGAFPDGKTIRSDCLCPGVVETVVGLNTSKAYRYPDSIITVGENQLPQGRLHLLLCPQSQDVMEAGGRYREIVGESIWNLTGDTSATNILETEH